MRKINFAEGQVYHIYNRGTDKRDVFSTDCDRYRFIQDLHDMNSMEPVLNAGYLFARNLSTYVDSDRGGLSCSCAGGNKKLVDILAFVLMPNHYHLLLTQRVEGGITAFMHKLGTAYTMYFNTKFKRSGALFQGRFKAIMIKEENHFEGIPFYIHANPLKLGAPFKSVGLEMAFLKSYRWSSFRDCAGLSNFPSVITSHILDDFFTDGGGFLASMAKYLENQKKRSIEAQPQ